MLMMTLTLWNNSLQKCSNCSRYKENIILGLSVHFRNRLITVDLLRIQCLVFCTVITEKKKEKRNRNTIRSIIHNYQAAFKACYIHCLRFSVESTSYITCGERSKLFCKQRVRIIVSAWSVDGDDIVLEKVNMVWFISLCKWIYKWNHKGDDKV